MGLNDDGLELGAAGIRDGVKYLQLHKSKPNSSGSEECSCARQSVSCTASAGKVTIPETDFTGLSNGEAVKYLGYWSAKTSGTFYGADELSGDSAANATGKYTVEESTITGSAG
jgi:hypothetical protein